MNTRKFTAGTHYLSPTDFMLDVDSSAGAVTLILPAIETYNEFQRRIGSLNQSVNYRFQDTAKTAGANNITFQANPQDKINNGVSVVISTNGANGAIVITKDTEWSLDAGNTGGGSAIDPAYGQVYRTSAPSETILASGKVPFDGIQNNLGVTFTAPNDIVIGKTGKYKVSLSLTVTPAS